MHIFLPDGWRGFFPDVQPTNAPTLPLYLMPTGLKVSPSKINIPSTYSSFTGSESIFLNELPGFLIQKYVKTLDKTII